MEFTTILACLVAIVAPCMCDFGGSYTDSLVGGLGNLRGVRSRGIIQGGDINCDCPIGTVCTIELGIRRCVTPGFVGSAGLAANIGRVGIRAGLRATGGIQVGRLDRLGNRGLDRGMIGGGLVKGAGGYGTRGVSTCGVMSPSCLATKIDRYAECKYTFDYNFNKCVKIDVCNSCAYLNGPSDNLFDTIYDCESYCY